MSMFPQIGGKWALYLLFTLLLIPFSMLILPFLLGCFKYTSLRYGHLNTTSQSWKEDDKTRAFTFYLYTCGSVIEAKRKSTLRAALQVPFLTTWALKLTDDIIRDVKIFASRRLRGID